MDQDTAGPNGVGKNTIGADSAAQDEAPVRTTLLRNGSIYSPADPFATAMLIQDGTVAWLGSDAAAEAHADEADETIDLDGALVTPAFVDAHVHATVPGWP